MKDYSKYFKNVELSDIDSSYGFITKLEVIENKVYVWTPQTKKGEPRIYGIEKLPYFQERLEKQYQAIIDNQEIIKKAHMKPRKKIAFIITLAIIATLMTKGASLMFADSLVSGIALLTGSPLVISFLSLLGISKAEQKIEEEMEIYKDYLTKRTDIETLSKSDENIIENLSKNTKEAIISKEVLKDSGKINQVYDMDFMDKTSLKELRKLIENYNQSKRLFIEQEFVDPNKAKELIKSSYPR